jgi:hypothetical protein
MFENKLRATEMGPNVLASGAAGRVRLFLFYKIAR